MTHPPGLYLDSGEFIPAEEVNRRMAELQRPCVKPPTKAKWPQVLGGCLLAAGFIGSLFFAAWGSV